MRLKTRLAASVIAINLAMDVAAQEAVPAAPTQAPLAIRLTDGVIKDAVKETLASAPTPRGAQLDRRVLSGDKYESFARKLDEAKVPDCVHADALKHQPHSVEYGGWVFGVGDIYAAPFWVAAVVRGKCNLLPR